jgi:glycosyltransferase involved in cell wall biosynthesis
MILFQQKMKTVIVIPVFNEEKTIGNVLSDLNKNNYNDIIVVDDASSDKSAEIARNYNCMIIEHLINRGQGAALKTGIVLALNGGADYIVTFDADGQHQVGDIKLLLEPLYAKKCEVTLGSRYLTELSQRKIPLMRKVLHRLAIVYTNFTTRLNLSDTHNGLRAMTAVAAEKIHFSQDRYAHASEILEEIAHKHISSMEIPVTISYTDYSLAKGQKIGDFIKILFKIFVNKLR